jgi:hypothetical protein
LILTENASSKASFTSHTASYWEFLKAAPEWILSHSNKFIPPRSGLNMLIFPDIRDVGSQYGILTFWSKSRTGKPQCCRSKRYSESR